MDIEKGRLLYFPLEGKRAYARFKSLYNQRLDHIEMEIQPINETLPPADQGTVLRKYGGGDDGFCISIRGCEDNKLYARARVYEIPADVPFYVFGDVSIEKPLQNRGLHRYLISSRILVCLEIWNASPRQMLWAAGRQAIKAQKLGFCEDSKDTVATYPAELQELAAQSLRDNPNLLSGLFYFDEAARSAHIDLVRKLIARDIIVTDDSSAPGNPITMLVGPKLRGHLRNALDYLDTAPTILSAL